MTSSPDYVGAPETIVRQTTLKLNKYKRVCLGEDRDGRKFITKSYSGHPEKYSKINTQYVHETLSFFHREFAGILVVPTPYGIDVEKHTVFMEYINILPTAKLLNKRTLGHAESFFKKCYSIRDDQGFLRSISDSVYFVEPIQTMLNTGFPISLGLKGDLWQNLTLAGRKLILADLDSAALEPLGLSELIMYCEIAASFQPKNLMVSSEKITPVCFQYLERDAAVQVSEAAQEIFRIRMQHLPRIVAAVKLTFARRFLADAMQHYFSN